MERLPHTFIQITQRLLVLALATSLSSCDLLSGRAAVDIDDYTTQYSHIRAWGGSKIYWIDNTSLVVAASLKTESKEYEKGIFKINIDGTYRRIADISDGNIRSYCFYDGVLTLHARDVFSVVTSNVSDVNVDIAALPNDWSGFLRGYIRCNPAPLIGEDFVFEQALLPEDGYLFAYPGSNILSEGDKALVRKSNHSTEKKNYWSTDWFNKVGRKQPIWELRVGKTIKNSIRLDGQHYWPLVIKQYSEFDDSYIGSAGTNTDCVDLFRLNRKNWRPERKQICLENSASGGSRVLTPTKFGVLFNRHSGGKHKGLYLVEDSKSTFLKKGDVRNESISPDGCKLAITFGEQEYNAALRGYMRKRLQIIDLCAYSSDKKSRSDALQAKT